MGGVGAAAPGSFRLAAGARSPIMRLLNETLEEGERLRRVVHTQLKLLSLKVVNEAALTVKDNYIRLHQL
jgi:hypothetical protein